MADFEEIVHLKVKYDEAVARKAKWDIETLQAKAAGIQITPTLKQESFRRAAAQLDALTNLRHATVRVNVDSRSVNDSLATLKNSINNTKFSVQLDKTGFENKLRELELKRDQLGEKFRVGFKTKLDADAAILSMRKLQQEADTLHNKLNRRETLNVNTDTGSISTLSEALKNAVINAGSLHRMVGAISPQVLAGAAAFALLAGSVALTAAAVGGAVVGIGAIAAAALSSNETVKTSYAGMVAEIKNSVTGMSETLIPTFVNIATKVRESFREVAPDIRAMMVDAGPALESMVDGALAAAKKLIPGIRAMIANAQPVIEGVSNALMHIATSVNGVFERMARSSSGAGAGFELLGKAVAHVIDSLGALIEVANYVAGALGLAEDAVKGLVGVMGGPAAKAGVEDFKGNVLSLLNPLVAFTKTAEAATNAYNHFAKETISGKAVADPTFRPKVKVEIDSTLSNSVGNAIKREIGAAQSAINQAIESTKLGTIGGRFEMATDKTQAQDALAHLTSLREAWVSAEKAGADAQANVGRVQRQNESARKGALDGIVTAERALQNAQRDSVQAQESLNEARGEAQENLVTLRAKLRDLGDNEEAARIRIERAKAAQVDVSAARQEAAQNLANLRNKVSEMGASEEAAQLRLERARMAQVDVNKVRQEAAQHIENLRDKVRELSESEEAAQLRIVRARHNLVNVDKARQEAAQNLVDLRTRLDQAASAEEAGTIRYQRAWRAQVDLNDARREAIRILEDGRARLRDLGDSEEAGRLRVERARLAAQEAGLAPGQEFTPEQLAQRAAIEANLKRRESLLELKNAEEELQDTIVSNQATRAEVAELERIGVENSHLVVEAKFRQKEAALELHNAEEGLWVLTRERETAQKNLNEAYRLGVEGSAVVVEAKLREREASLELRNAEGALAEIIQQGREARAELTEASRLGVEGSPAVVEAKFREREAALELRNAETNLTTTMADNVAVRAQLAEAERLGIENSPIVLEALLRHRENVLELKNAEEGLYDVLRENESTRQVVAEAERRGIENSPIVLAAKQRLHEAIFAEKDANENLTEANWRLEDVLRENAQRTLEALNATNEARGGTDQARAAYENMLRVLGMTDSQLLTYTKHLNELPKTIDQFIKLHGLEDVLKGAARLGMEIDAQKLMAEHPDWSPEQALQHASARYIGRDLVGKVQAFESKMRETLGSIPFLGGRRDGGPISGPGDARSDSVMIAAASGEFMQPVDAVQHYGTGFMEAVRKKQFPRFADGGSVGLSYDWNVDTTKWPQVEMLRKSGIVQRARQAADAFYAPTLSGGIGLGSSSEHSWGQIHQVAKKFDPGAILTSHFRPGDPGNHGKGLAADFGGNMEAIAKGFFGIKESLMQLIYSGGRGYFVAGGKEVSGPGYYGGQTISEHFNHVHVAARKDAMEAILSGGSGGSVNAPGSGVERWRGAVNQALGIMGQPLSLANSTLRRMNQESGGDPNVVNRWDSNWHAGHPSVGLMQVIRGTYAANKHPGHDRGPYEYGVSKDPMSNILASMKYALGRYGSLNAAYDRPGGYKDGGFVADDGALLAPGVNVLNNKTGRPEPLLNAQKEINLSVESIRYLARILAQVLSQRPAALMLPNGDKLAETISDSMMGEATLPGVSF